MSEKQITEDDVRRIISETDYKVALNIDHAQFIEDLKSTGEIGSLAAALAPVLPPSGITEDSARAIAAQEAEGRVGGAVADAKNQFAAFIEAKLAEIAEPETRRKVVKKAAAILGVVGSGTAERALSKYAQPHNSKYPILFFGPPSAGKTYAARKWGEQNFDLYVEFHCHAGVEGADFLGGPILIAEKGGTSSEWVDGPAAQAVRAAAAGQSVLFLADEIYRCPVAEQNTLLTFLSGVKKDDGSRWYRLCTQKPIKDAAGNWTKEVIECPRENLAIVATTNIGTQFFVSPSDGAFKSRWELVFVDVTEADIRSFASREAQIYGLGHRAVETATLLFVELNILKADGFCEESVTYRAIERVFECAASDSDQHLYEAYIDRLNGWVATNADGKPEEAQVEKVKEVLQRVFPNAVS